MNECTHRTALEHLAQVVKHVPPDGNFGNPVCYFCADCGMRLELVITVKKGELMESYDIGKALMFLKNGGKMQRVGWNGKGMYLELQEPDENSKMTLPYIYMFTAQGDLVPWLASQTDILAQDWVVFDDGQDVRKQEVSK